MSRKPTEEELARQAAKHLGSMGGKERVRRQSAKERKESASKAARARWKRAKKDKG